MPLALLLQNVTAVLRSAAAALAPWLEIVPLEATIVERARSAFLVHWFGPRLPFDGLSLRVHVANTDALAQQYALAVQSIPASRRGPNLTEPLLGLAGLVAGTLLSPAGVAAGVSALFRVADLSLTTFLVALAWIAAPLLLIFGLAAAPAGTAILFAGGITAGVGGYALALGLGDSREVRAVFNIFGALARLMNGSIVFIEQLLGPRSEVRNPLLRSLLDLADGLAALLAQALGAIAVLVTRIGPVLQPTSELLVALLGLLRAGGAVLGEIVGGLLDRFEQLLAVGVPIATIFTRVATAATERLAAIQAALSEQFTLLGQTLREVGTALREAFGQFRASLVGFFTKLVGNHPTVRVIRAFKTQIGVITSAWASVPAPPSTGPSFLAPLVAALPPVPPLPTFPAGPFFLGEADIEQIRLAMGGASVPELSLESIERAAAQLGSMTRTQPIELGEEARQALDAAARRPSAFAGARRRLQEEASRGLPQVLPLEEALQLRGAELDRYREAFSVIVGRVLPPALRATYAPALGRTLAMLDRRLYGVDRAVPEEDDFPVLDLPTSERLQPEIRSLRLRMPGSYINDVKRFQDLVVDRLRRQSYEVRPVSPAEAGVP